MQYEWYVFKKTKIDITSCIIKKKQIISVKVVIRVAVGVQPKTKKYNLSTYKNKTF